MERTVAIVNTKYDIDSEIEKDFLGVTKAFKRKGLLIERVHDMHFTNIKDEFQANGELIFKCGLNCIMYFSRHFVSICIPTMWLRFRNNATDSSVMRELRSILEVLCAHEILYTNLSSDIYNEFILSGDFNATMEQLLELLIERGYSVVEYGKDLLRSAEADALIERHYAPASAAP